MSNRRMQLLCQRGIKQEAPGRDSPPQIGLFLFLLLRGMKMRKGRDSKRRRAGFRSNKTSTSSTHFSTRSHDMYATGKKYKTCNRVTSGRRFGGNLTRRKWGERGSWGEAGQESGGQFGSSGRSTAATWWPLLGMTPSLTEFTVAAACEEEVKPSK